MKLVKNLLSETLKECKYASQHANCYNNSRHLHFMCMWSVSHISRVSSFLVSDLCGCGMHALSCHIIHELSAL